MAAEGRIVNLGAEEWAQAEGDDRSGLFIEIDGLLHSYFAPLGDKVIMVGFPEAGAVLGHATRYSGGPRLVKAVCTEPSVILEVSETAVDRIAADTPEIWRAIADFSYNNMRRALRLAAEVISLRPRERIAARLLALAKTDPNDGALVVKVSQEMLGEMIGVTRKTINQSLSKFEQEGYISLGYGRIEIQYIKNLRRIVASQGKTKPSRH